MANQKVLVVVSTKSKTKKVWYDKKLHYAADEDHDRAGEPFYIHERAFKKDAQGKLMLKDGQPILPPWARRVTPQKEAAFLEQLAEQENRKKRAMGGGPKKSSGDEDVI